MEISLEELEGGGSDVNVFKSYLQKNLRRDC